MDLSWSRSANGACSFEVDGRYRQWAYLDEVPVSDPQTTAWLGWAPGHGGTTVRNPFKRRSKEGLSAFERSMFSIMGPPELGENRARDGYVPDPADELCGKCGQRWEAHERVHTGSVTYRRCPQ